MPDSERHQLCALAQELSDTVPFDRAQELDREFQSLIAEGGGDEMITALLESMRRRGQDYRILELGEERGPEMKRISDQAHRDIARAITEREPETAKFLMMQHIRTTRRWLEGLWPEPTVR